MTVDVTGASDRTNLRAGRRPPLSDLPESWAIGLFCGPSPVALAPHPGVRNPVLTRRDVTDRAASFVADPFLQRVSDQWYMFFELKDYEREKGVIALARSDDSLVWSYEGVVLEEPYHLSYPYVFAAGGDHFMVPETLDAGAVRLYRATAFPTRWEHIADLVPGRHADPSIFEADGTWWVFTCSAPFRHDTLRLFGADCLSGPWREHPESPVRQNDPRRARPAGRVVRAGGDLFRFAQDCRPRYGTSVRAFEITVLSRHRYQEVELAGGPVLSPGPPGWQGAGMHHVDALRCAAGGWLACVDGRFG